MRAVGSGADGWRSMAPAAARPWQASRLPGLDDGGSMGLGFFGRCGVQDKEPSRRRWEPVGFSSAVWCGREGTEPTAVAGICLHFFFGRCGVQDKER
jgi:hypothetical protein